MSLTRRKEIYVMANQSSNIIPQDLIPESWFGIHASTEADLIFTGSKNLERLKQYWQREQQLKRSKASRTTYQRRATSHVRYLTKIMRKAEEKPYFASYRPYDLFNIDDRVMLFAPDLPIVLPHKVKTFTPGRIIDGFFYHKGGVTVLLDEPVATIKTPSNPRSGRVIFIEIARPEVLHGWEFNYLKSHPDYLKIWTHSSEESLPLLASENPQFEFDSEGFIAAIIKA